jgi:hypothetical protein
MKRKKMKKLEGMKELELSIGMKEVKPKHT